MILLFGMFLEDKSGVVARRKIKIQDQLLSCCGWSHERQAHCVIGG